VLLNAASHPRGKDFIYLKLHLFRDAHGRQFFFVKLSIYFLSVLVF
jgi:hypothetical protein